MKPVSTQEYAALAVAHGADAIIVSNHGGRQLDGAPVALHALSRLAPAAWLTCSTCSPPSCAPS